MATPSRRYVIIGNGIAGTTCAQTLRKDDPSCDIWLITNEPYPLYNRVSLKRMLDGVMPEQKVMMRDHAWHEQQRITLLTETYATHVDTSQRVVYLSRGGPLAYNGLLLATGGWPNPLEAEGTSGARHIHSFVTLDDTRAIVERVAESKAAVVTGGSYMAYDLTEGLTKRGLHVTWLMRGPFWLRRVLDEEGGRLVEEIASRHGVEVVHGEQIASVITEHGVPRRVVGTTGREYPADMIGVGIGLQLNHAFLSDTPIERASGIRTDEHLRTNVPDVYAAGDVAEFFDPLTRRYRTIGTWDNALAQGQIAARNMAGGDETFLDVPTRSSPIFDTNIVVVGLAEGDNPALTSIARTLRNEQGGTDYRKFFFHENRLVGSVFIGSPKGRRKLVEMIRSGYTCETAADRERLFEVR